jgi:hypothetical protein
MEHFEEFIFSKIPDDHHTGWPRVERIIFKSIKWLRFQTGNRKIIDLYYFTFLKGGHM